MFEKAKEKYNKKVYQQYSDCLNDISDLFGDGHDGMSSLFYLWNRRYLHWLDNDPEKAVYKKEIRFRKKIYPLLQKVGPGILKCKQVFENRKSLDDPLSNEPDESVTIPDKPVIFVSNHGFHDDVLATTLAAKRHVYFLWGSLPLLYNSFDGLAAGLLIGNACVNRRNKESRKASLNKALKILELGTSLAIFPEGVWNKTPEKLVLDLWKGVYDISIASQCSVVPIVHYVRDMEILSKKNIIHTVVDDPIELYKMPQHEAVEYLRDVLASWQWKMMERYGQSTRSAEMKDADSADERWDQLLKERIKGVDRYDSQIEKKADYRPKDIMRIEDVFEPVANVPAELITAQNAKIIMDAKKLVRKSKDNDFQMKY